MPQLQVIGREQDTFADSLNKFAETQRNRILKKQALELSRRELQIKAKAADNETAKAEAESQMQVVEIMKSINEGDLKGPAAGVMLKKSMAAAGMSMGDFVDGSKIVMDNMQALVKSMQPGPDEATKGQARRGEITRDVAEADQTKAITNLIRGQGGGGVPGGTQLSPTPQVQPDVTGRVPIQGNARAGAVGGNLELTGINAGGVQLANVPAKARLAAAETTAREGAKFAAELAPVRQVYTAYIEQMEKAVQEIGGLPKTNALAARFKGEVSKMAAEIGNLPETQAFKREFLATRLNIASFINRGRPTEPDAEAAGKSMPDIVYPQATNAALMRFNNKLLSVPPQNQGDTTRLRGMMKDAKTNIRDVGIAFREKALAEGHDPDQIEATLKQYYQSQGL